VYFRYGKNKIKYSVVREGAGKGGREREKYFTARI